MQRVLFRYRGIEILPYPACLGLGLTVGVIAGTAAGEGRGVSAIPLYAALLVLIIPALAGSRLLYVLTNWGSYRHQPSLVWSRNTGGASLYGGLLLALACSWPVLHVFGIPFGAFWDAATITMLVGMVFTKIGCLLNGCCAGRETTSWFALNLPNTSGVWRRRIPTQLLECALAAGLLVGCLSWSARPFDGAVFLTALAIYGAARLPLGAMRESLDRLGGVNIHNLLSAVLALAAVASLGIVWWIRHR